MTQLEMLWPESRLDELPTWTIPQGYELRTYAPGDEPGFLRLMDLAGFGRWGMDEFRTWLGKVLPEGFFVVVHQATRRIVATAMATHHPTDRHPFGGELGWLAADPQHTGKGLGTLLCAAVTRRFLEAGYKRIYLLTDDWRLPALAIYLKLGWVPYLFEADMPGRWKAACEHLDWPYTPESWPREEAVDRRARSLKVYITTDLEGISGVTVFEQTRDPNPKLRDEALELLMGDVNAAVQGCLDGGATQVVVLDGHGAGLNFIPSKMHPGAHYVTGIHRPEGMCGLDETFDAMVLVGYHAMMGTDRAILHHSQSSKTENRYWYNDVEMGEIGQEAIFAGHYGVPIVMVTGDKAACEEAHALLGKEITTVAVKEGYGRQCGKLVPPQRAHEMIQEGAKRALGCIGRCKPYAFSLPIHARLQFGTKDFADDFTPKLSKRVDDRTFEATFGSALDILGF
jgi:D-aminopeptidase/GNAT superfamily N-acetyltransferase